MTREDLKVYIISPEKNETDHDIVPNPNDVSGSDIRTNIQMGVSVCENTE